MVDSIEKASQKIKEIKSNLANIIAIKFRSQAYLFLAKHCYSKNEGIVKEKAREINEIITKCVEGTELKEPTLLDFVHEF